MGKIRYTLFTEYSKQLSRSTEEPWLIYYLLLRHSSSEISVFQKFKNEKMEIHKIRPKCHILLKFLNFCLRKSSKAAGVYKSFSGIWRCKIKISTSFSFTLNLLSLNSTHPLHCSFQKQFERQRPSVVLQWSTPSTWSAWQGHWSAFIFTQIFFFKLPAMMEMCGKVSREGISGEWGAVRQAFLQRRFNFPKKAETYRLYYIW